MLARQHNGSHSAITPPNLGPAPFQSHQGDVALTSIFFFASRIQVQIYLNSLELS